MQPNLRPIGDGQGGRHLSIEKVDKQCSEAANEAIKGWV